MSYPELSRKARSFIGVVVMAGTAGTAVLGFLRSQAHLSDFTGYLTAARIVVKGDSIPQMYNDSLFREQVKTVSQTDTNMVMYVNPPAISVLMTPLATMNPFHAKLMWNLIAVVVLIIIWYLGKNIFGIPDGSGLEILFFGMLAATLPFLRNLQHGQIYVVMLFLVVLFWKGFKTRRPWLAGCSLAILILLKYFGWMFIPFLLLQRRWKELSITIGAITVGTGALVLALGIETYFAHFDRLLASFRTMDVAFTGLPSIPAFIGRTVVTHLPGNGAALIAAEGWIWGLISALMLLMLVPSLRSTDNASSESANAVFFAILTLSVLFTPLAADHHYILLTFPSWFVLSQLVLRNASIWMFAGYGLLLYGIFGWLPTQLPTSPDAVFSWSSSARLLAGVVLWFLLLRCAKQKDKTPVPIIP